MSKLINILIYSSLFLCQFLLKGQDTISVMSYNLLNYSSSDGNGNRYLDLRTIVKASKPDVLLVCEIKDENSCQYLLDSAINKAGNGNYARATFFDGTDTDNMLYYKTNVVGLKSQKQIYTVLRDISQYRIFKVLAPNDTAFIYLHSAHLKAGTTANDEIQRNSEVMAFCSSIASIPQGANVLFAGDLNLKGSIEPAYNTLTSSNCSHMFYDPTFQSGTWNNNSTFKYFHTQSTRTNTKPGCCGGSTGGLDDRFDLILLNTTLQQGNNKVKYILGSYKAYGNDGQHMNLAITDNPVNSVVSSTVTQALFNMSDHLPVHLKFELKSNVISVKENSKKNIRLQIKNVIDGETSKLFVSCPKSDNYNLEIYDLNGKLVLTKLMFIEIGEGRIDLPFEFVKNRMYTISLRSNEYHAQCKFTSH